MKRDLARKKPAWSSTSTANSPAPTVATSIATRKGHGWNRSPSTATKAKQAHAKSTARESQSSGISRASLPSNRTNGSARSSPNFFQMLRTHTIEGMFCDPLHGGNVDMIGWQLIGYPGPLRSYRDDIDNYGKPFRRKP